MGWGREPDTLTLAAEGFGMKAFVFLKVVYVREVPPLVLTRDPLPKFLRFVVTGDDWQTLDALDQLDDEPKAVERVIAAKMDGKPGTLHLDRWQKGRGRVGEWYRTADYWPVAEQPPDDVLRDREKWRAWCLAEVAKGSPTTEG